MNIYELPYSYYIVADKRKRQEIDLYIEYGTFEVKDYFGEKDLADRPFIIVKRLMEAINNQDDTEFAELLNEIPEYNGEKLLTEPCYKVLITIKYLINRVIELAEIEAQMLVSKYTREDYSSYVEQVDFSVFPHYYSQIRTLAQEDIRRYKEIEQMKYSDCITELIYITKSDDLEKLILKKTKK